ncbi:hypothetical protein MJO52_00495 [Microbulbifer variabilis]|uniref:Aerotolerance regulator N-terminal domain-containing protein n=1 Tax=Microbulbifer variabilis TaxID=266805 RepID=A0ABY4VES9_9GAMM|nr:hypothetical protein [Microbulbifer variabilis]USD21653.1 hypothetical protein MJO52_00495 [Microbulbifer variabilis]
MINFLIPGLCLLACLASLVLLRRRGAKPFDYGLQLVIWLSAWMLWQPPAIIPAERNISIDSKQLASSNPINLNGVENISLNGEPLGRDKLRDLAPVRLELSNIQESDSSWEFDWQRQITLGDSLKLKVHNSQPLTENVKISLLNPYGHIEDSLELKVGETIQAQLTATPKLAGPQLYRVRTESETGETHTDPLPILVREPLQPKLLLWLARPSFETAALSRWLRQSGVTAQVMTQLAPEISRKETLNGLPLTESADLFTNESPFDLVILDSSLWPQFSALQKRQLNELATTKSLLWLVSDDSSEEFLQYAAAQSMPLQKEEATHLHSGFGYQKADNPEIPPLRNLGFKVTQPGSYDFLLGNGEPPLFWGRSTETQHLGFILFSDSHRWLTSGFTTEFANLWKSIIDYQLKHLGSQPPVTLSNKLPRTQERTILCSPLFSNQRPILFSSQENSLPISGVAVSSNSQGQCYSFWPQGSGWHQLKTDMDGEPVLNFYIFAKQDWPKWQRSLNAREARQMAAARLGPVDNRHSGKMPIERQWPALILLLLVCTSWWRERRILNRPLS